MGLGLAPRLHHRGGAGRGLRRPRHRGAGGPGRGRAGCPREAVSFAGAAGYSAAARIEGGNRAHVTVTGSYETLFLGIIGVNSIGIEVEGTARAVTTLDGAEA